MDITVDASALIAYVVGATANHVQAAQHFSAATRLFAPAIIRAEAYQVLRRLEKTLGTPQLQPALALIDQLPFSLVPFRAPLSARAWALRHNLTIYDAWYVAVAEGTKTPLLTGDLRLVRAVQTLPILPNQPRCQLLVI